MHRTALVAFAALSSSAALAAIQPFPGTVGTSISSSIPPNFEQSGLLWHSNLQCLFAVSDDGRVMRLEADGSLPKVWSVGNLDLEDITVADPASDFIYLAIEYPDAIAEFRLSTGTITRTFPLAGGLNPQQADGIEGLTFVPDANAPEGGEFWAGQQLDGRVFRFRLPIKSSSTSTSSTFLGSFQPVVGRADVSALSYDAQSDSIYIAWDKANVIGRASRAGQVLEEWQLPGSDQEGICVRGCELFVGDDVLFTIWKHESFPSLAACDRLAADQARVSLALGGVVDFTIYATDGVPPSSLYALAGSASGTTPGLVGPSFTIPLMPDGYFNLTLSSLNVAPFVNTLGTITANAGVGPAHAQLVIPTGLPPVLVGITLHHAFLAADPSSQVLVGASNAQILVFVP